MHTNSYIKYIFLSGMFFIIILMSGVDIYAENEKIKILNQKLDEITILREKINEKDVLLNDILDEIKSQENNIITEINIRQKKTKVKTYEKAIQSPRIYFDLKLAVKLNKYMAQINKKILFLHTSDEDLRFMFEQTKDDLKIAQTLNNIKINELISNIDQLTNNIYLQIDKKISPNDKVSMKTGEKIWAEITSMP